MIANALKTQLKKSPAVHSAYKFARDFQHIPPSRLLSFDTMQDIFRVLPKTMLTMPRLFDLHDLVRIVNRDGVDGCFVECGVWNGGAIGLMGLADRRFPGQKKRTLHLFDSFEGLPQPTARDTDVFDGHDAGDVLTPIGACKGERAPVVEDFLVNRLGLPKDQLAFHVGWFQDTVPVACSTIGDIAILRLDGDWYESTKVCIENLYDRLVPGGFLVIDDYGAFEGCRQAVDEFFSSRGAIPQWVWSDKHCVYFRKDGGRS